MATLSSSSLPLFHHHPSSTRLRSSLSLSFSSIRYSSNPTKSRAPFLVLASSAHSFDDFTSKKSVLSELIQEIEPLDVSHIQKDVPPTTADAMKRTISGMLGLLPSDQFHVVIEALWEPLSKLLVSSMMTGYTLRNAEYRLCLERNLDLCDRDLEKPKAEGTKFDLQGLLHDSVNVIDFGRKNNLSSNAEKLHEDVDIQDLGEMSAEAQQFIFSLQSRLSSMKKVAYLRRGKGNSTSNPSSIPIKILPKPEIKNASSVEVQEPEEKVEERNDDENSNIEAATEEGIKSVINFLKDKIPGLKVKVMKIDVEEAAEGSDSIKQLMEDGANKTSSNQNPEEEVNNLDEPDEVTLEGDVDASEEEKDLDMKLFVGGIVNNNEDTAAKDDFVRLPAEIKNMERDSFVFHIPKSHLDYVRKEEKVRNIKVAALAAQGISELMPSDVAKAFWSSDKVSSKVSKSMRDIVKLAGIQAQKNNRLSEDTYFSRITPSKGAFDPFDGLYVGAFGPYGIEIVQLKRKFGHWNNVDNENNTSDVEFFEYVEAVKLTGDLNVPAGQVTFRAKIGKVNRNANRGMYPDELGVVASYKGQGRIADLGFKNPKWVDGELLQLNGKGMGPYMKGSDLGFLYVVPEQSFLVLFNRLKLPE